MLRFRMKKVRRNESNYLSDEAMRWLPERGEATDSDIIFTLPKNDSANKQLARWIKSAGITKRITFHCSRHSYIFLFTRNKKLTRNKLLDR